MAYGLNPDLFVENGPTIHAARTAAARRSGASYRAWRTLDENRRMALVERALREAANDDGPDDYPVAL